MGCSLWLHLSFFLREARQVRQCPTKLQSFVHKILFFSLHKKAKNCLSAEALSVKMPLIKEKFMHTLRFASCAHK